MRHALKLMALTAALTIAACDGPRENAGEQADADANLVGSEDTLRSGPAEEMGAKQDAAAESQADAIEARAESIEDSAEQAREAARQRASALRKEAEETRKVEPAPSEADVNGM